MIPLTKTPANNSAFSRRIPYKSDKMRSCRLTTILCCLAAAPALAQSATVPGRVGLLQGRPAFRLSLQPKAARQAPNTPNGFIPDTPTVAYSFIDYPGWSSTQAWGVNLGAKSHGKMYIVGGQGYQLANGPGFVLTPSTKGSDDIQKYQPLAPSEPYLTAVSVNDFGDTAGVYQDNVGTGTHGFLLEKSKFTTLDVPFGQGYYTEAYGVNDAGLVVGAYAVPGETSAVSSFTYAKGVYAQFSYPGATQTSAAGVNTKGDITGGYVDASGVLHGFLFSNGVFTTVDPPGSLNTYAQALNDSDEIIGEYCTTQACITNFGPYQFFTYSQGVFTSLPLPWSGEGTYSTYPNGINDAGTIVGQFADQAGFVHGFLATP